MITVTHGKKVTLSFMLVVMLGVMLLALLQAIQPANVSLGFSSLRLVGQLTMVMSLELYWHLEVFGLLILGADFITTPASLILFL